MAAIAIMAALKRLVRPGSDNKLSTEKNTNEPVQSENTINDQVSKGGIFRRGMRVGEVCFACAMIYSSQELLLEKILGLSPESSVTLV